MSDVIVIGGGIAGCSTAYYLALDGVDVLLLDQADLCSGASGANSGNLHVQIQPEPFEEHGAEWAHRFMPAIPFFMHSMRLWDEAASALDHDLGIRRVGGPDDCPQRHGACDAARQGQDRGRFRFARRSAVAQGLAGTSLPTCRNVRPEGFIARLRGWPIRLQATTAFAAAAEAAGTTILRDTSVIDIERTDTGFEVVTESGLQFCTTCRQCSRNLRRSGRCHGRCRRRLNRIRDPGRSDRAHGTDDRAPRLRLRRAADRKTDAEGHGTDRRRLASHCQQLRQCAGQRHVAGK